MSEKVNVETIRRLNDTLRTTGIGGRIMITSGIEALGPEMVQRVLKAVSGFDGFSRDNDPHGEHDCAVLDVEGIRVLWKIDYYDQQLQYHSADPADETITVRVMTVMSADEY